jgi:hypothetical protein
MALSAIQEGVDRFTNDLSVYTVLMGRQQLNEIQEHSADLYNSTRKECESLAVSNRKEINSLRKACREKLDETLFKIGEKLVVNNDKEITHLKKTLLVEHDLMTEKYEKQQVAMDHHIRELSKVLFLSARCYLILRRNGIVEDDKEWTANDEKRKTTEMIEDSQKKISKYDRQIREMRVNSTQLEEAFETKAIKDPAVLQALKYLPPFTYNQPPLDRSTVIYSIGIMMTTVQSPQSGPQKPASICRPFFLL